MARTVDPPGADTLWVVGDMHFGAMTATRYSKITADMGTARSPKYAAIVHPGDVTELGIGSEDSAALAWFDQFLKPYYLAIGNHDIINQVRTPLAAAQAWGMVAPGSTIADSAWDPGGDFPLLLFPSPAPLIGASGNIAFSAATLAWLDAQLAAATKDCIVVCHAPLANTVVGDTGLVYSSVETEFNVDPDADLRAILNARSNAKIFLSGHTHSPVDTEGFLKVESVGSRNILAINASAPHYVGRSREDATDPIRTLFLTFRPGFVDVRVRDHGSGVWATIGGSRKTSLAIPA